MASGCVGGGRKLGCERRQNTDWVSWTDAVGSLALPVKRAETLLDLLDIKVEVQDESDLGLTTPHMEFVPRLFIDTSSCFGGK